MSHLVTRRPATESDKEFARQVHHAAYRDVVVRQFGEWNDQLQDGFFEADWADGRFAIVLCDGEPCGYCSMERSPEVVVLRELVVSPEFQGRGIGTALLREMINEAKSDRIPIRLGALRENRALELYRRMGFKDSGQSDTHIEFEYRP